MKGKKEEDRKKSSQTSPTRYRGCRGKESLQIESFNRVSLDSSLWRRRQVGSSPMLVHSPYKAADDMSEEFKDIFFS